MKFVSKFLAISLALSALTSFRPYPQLSLYSGKQPRSPIRTVANSIDTGSSSPAGSSLRGHSHNDYEHSHPLTDALAHRFVSVEADIWLNSGNIMVSHYGWFFTGSLRELYLEPLRKRVEELGSVHGDGRPFYLWLDIKDGDTQLIPALQRLLQAYPMFTRFGREGVQQRPVTVILSGRPSIKKGYVRGNAIRYAQRDDWIVDKSDPASPNESDPWKWYTLNWFNYLTWGGEGDMPAQEFLRLRELVRLIHSKGRKVRFWGAPETPGIWAASIQAGVDLIGTNDLKGFSDYARNAIVDSREGGRLERGPASF